ncbi:diacylglycerol kinase [Glaciimonas sp. PAMC28666]|uniref:diacylglycerol kinase n=1 Tax=Glaciimonas sp. PAMC28666 TaxID=2807626 RepID=UPI0019666E4E|nr:diacylglycerol kinase [Glaciimonas sp. PAMC28666]QRX81871.1 diacylglycerol kinase [Glaciimonas sp. PAMC28666]
MRKQTQNPSSASSAKSPSGTSEKKLAVEQPISEFKSTKGLKRIFSALFYSYDGLKSAWKNENAFRQELMVVVPGIIIAFFLPVSALQKLLLIAVLVWIIIVELINSAIEAVVDRVSLERNPLSKNAKDFGSAAVLLTCILALATWIVILYPLF